MTSLDQYQKFFCDAVLQSTYPRELGKDSHSVFQLFEQQKIEKEKAFSVYRNNVMHSLYRALAEVFSRIHDVLGKHHFQYLASQYIRNNPPNAGSVHLYGDSFPDFIESTHDFSYRFLQDLARLEWAYYKSSVCKHYPIFETNRLGKLHENQLVNLTFEFQPHLTLLTSNYPLDKVWADHSQENLEKCYKKVRKIYFAIYQRCDTVVILNIDTNCFSFLSGLERGLTLQEAWGASLSKTDLACFSSTFGYLLSLPIFKDINIKG